MVFVAWCFGVFGGGCLLLFVDCCLLFVALRVLFIVCCVLFVVLLYGIC